MDERDRDLLDLVVAQVEHFQTLRETRTTEFFHIIDLIHVEVQLGQPGEIFAD